MTEIDGSKLDPGFKYEVAARPGGENISLCFACGTCTASCPAAEVDDEYNPRRIIRQVLLGMREEVLASPVIWRCVLCYACYATCPQNVKFRDVMRALREIAVKDGYVRPGINQEVKALDRTIQTLRRDMVNALVSDPDEFAKLDAAVKDLTAGAQPRDHHSPG